MTKNLRKWNKTRKTYNASPFWIFILLYVLCFSHAFLFIYTVTVASDDMSTWQRCFQYMYSMPNKTFDSLLVVLFRRQVLGTKNGENSVQRPSVFDATTATLNAFYEKKSTKRKNY